MMDFYRETALAKSGAIVPIYKSGKSAHSKYSPEREGEAFAESAGSFDFAVFIGIAGGYHIEAAARKNPSARIIALEGSAGDIEFLKQNIPCVRQLSQNKNIVIAEAEKIFALLPELYFPAYYGSIKVLTLRSWAEENKDACEAAADRINSALKKISADFSVQSHFGALWQKNIFSNLRLVKKIQSEVLPRGGILKKTAAVIAAGPTLDHKIGILKKEREKYFIIATDTAYKILCRNKIVPDAAVSIDAQYLSAEHFCAEIFKDTIYVLDLAGNYDIAKKVHGAGGRVLYYSSGHPLAKAAAAFFNHGLLFLESGSGTVTIAAADFARKCGFRQIEIFGADFAYSSGKPYARGSYLDDLYRKGESRIFGAETSFTRLMYRTPLFPADGSCLCGGFLTNGVLQGYRESLISWIRQNGIQCKYEDCVYKLSLSATNATTAPDLAVSEFAAPDSVLSDNAGNTGNADNSENNRFNFLGFKEWLSAALDKVRGHDGLIPESALLLPLLAFIRRKSGQNKISINEAKNLALKRILLYNEGI